MCLKRAIVGSLACQLYASLLVVGMILGNCLSDDLSAATLYKPAKKPKLKQIDRKAEILQTNFLKEAEKLADQYYEAGYPEKSKQVLNNLLKMNPQAKNLKKKLAEIDKEVFDKHELVRELDVNQKTWAGPFAHVYSGKELRVLAEGSYRFITKLNITPQGFPTKDPLSDQLNQQVPCGALMGLLVPINKKGKLGKPGTPFLIGDKRQLKPEQEGLLFLKINAPAGHNCQGKLTIRIGGHFTEQ